MDCGPWTVDCLVNRKSHGDASLSAGAGAAGVRAGAVAGIGGAAGAGGGGLAYLVDARHRRVAIHNLTMCFGAEKSAPELRALARENFRRIGKNFACAAKTAAMSFEELRPHVEFVSHGQIVSPVLRSTAEGGPPAGEKPPSAVAAIGHFGNFELYARFQQLAPGYTCATTYRALRQPSLNRLVQSMRERSGCLFFERRFDAARR